METPSFYRYEYYLLQTINTNVFSCKAGNFRKVNHILQHIRESKSSYDY